MATFQSSKFNMLKPVYEYISYIILLVFLSLNFTQSQAKEPSTQQPLIIVSDAWMRPTNPGQEVGAAYMTLLSKQDISIVGVESSVTDSVEVHSMSMENGVMRMRMLENFELKAGKPYKLSPGGFHLMLFDLKKPMIVGEQVSFTLHFKLNNQAKNSEEYQQTIKMMVKNPPDNASH